MCICVRERENVSLCMWYLYSPHCVCERERMKECVCRGGECVYVCVWYSYGLHRVCALTRVCALARVRTASLSRHLSCELIFLTNSFTPCFRAEIDVCRNTMKEGSFGSCGPSSRTYSSHELIFSRTHSPQLPQLILFHRIPTYTYST